MQLIEAGNNCCSVIAGITIVLSIYGCI